MDSLEPKCTPLKHSYDACFNRWFEKYLALTMNYPSGGDRRRVLGKSKQEYDRDCGAKWTLYTACLKDALESRQLHELLDAARSDDPLSDPTKIEQFTDAS